MSSLNTSSSLNALGSVTLFQSISSNFIDSAFLWSPIFSNQSELKLYLSRASVLEMIILKSERNSICNIFFAL